MARRPNVVLIMADQLGAASLPSYGNGVVHAPHLDRLADEGVVFERALCASPLCAPSRASLMTGLLPSRTGVYDNAGELPAAIPTFAHHLRAAGYRTVLAGKMHFIGPDQLHGFEERRVPDVYPAGFDWVPDWRLHDDQTLPWYHDLGSVLRAGPVRRTLQLRYDAEVREQACRAVAESARDPERPLLLIASFTHPHDPYEVPPEYWNRYDGVPIDGPVHSEPPHPVDPPTRRLRAMFASDDVEVPEEQVLAARRGYYGAISLVDEHVGAILDALAAHGLTEDTVILFTSDHGDMLGERGLWYKMAPFEGSVRVPLLVHAPGRFPARRVAAPVSLLDLLPTLVELAGAGDAGAVDGVSLLEALEGGEAPQRDVPLEYLAEGVRAPQVTVVRGARKLVRGLGEPDLVYDLDADPYERAGLAGDDSLARAAGERWDITSLDAAVRASQERRRLVVSALFTGALTAWDHPGTPGGPYIRTGDDFWETLEAARQP